MLQKCRIILALGMKNNFAGIELYKKAMSHLQFQQLECPYCGEKGKFKRHGKYSRYVVEWIEGQRHCSSISVIRFRCGNCRKTHAYLPSFLIPYTSYGMCFVLTVLIQYFKGDMTVEQICGKYDISESMLYRWVHAFENCYEKWAELLRYEITVWKNKRNEIILGNTDNILQFILCVIWSDVFLDNYLLMFRKSLMECGFEGDGEKK